MMVDCVKLLVQRMFLCLLVISTWCSFYFFVTFRESIQTHQEKTIINSHVKDTAIYDTESQWKRRHKSTVKKLLEEIDLEYGTEFNTETKMLPPIIILGSAGTGTRVVHNILQENGVQMSEIVNNQKDSRVFTEFVKNNEYFGTPSSLYSNTSLISFVGKIKSVNYNISDIDSLIAHGIDKQIQKAKRILEIEYRMKTNFTMNKKWGFKEPQALFVLPFLLNAWNSTVDHPIHIIHVIRDGRDMAFSKQQKKTFQAFYVNTFTKNENDSQKDEGTINADKNLSHLFQVGKTWQYVNIGVQQWALEHPNVKYINVRLEDLCSSSREYTIKSLLSFLNIDSNHSKHIDSKAIDDTRCNLGKYLQFDSKIVHALSQVISRGLISFNYPIDSLPSLIKTNAFRINNSDVQKTIILTFVNSKYINVFKNWIIHMINIKKTRGILVITTSMNLYKVLNCKYLERGCNLYQVEDKKLHEICKHLDLASFYIPWDNTKKITENIWFERVRIMEVAISLGINVLLTDLDAIWMKDPFAYGIFGSQSLMGADFNPSNVDIIASRGRFPQFINIKWGATICMGFLFIRSSNATRSLLHYTLEGIKIMKDDQKSFNSVIEDYFSPRWKASSLKNHNFTEHEIMFGEGSLRTDRSVKISLIILPFELVPRYCLKDLQDKNLPSNTNLKNFYSNALVIHCLSKKTGEDKKQIYLKTGLWKNKE